MNKRLKPDSHRPGGSRTRRTPTRRGGVLCARGVACGVLCARGVACGVRGREGRGQSGRTLLGYELTMRTSRSPSGPISTISSMFWRRMWKLCLPRSCPHIS